VKKVKKLTLNKETLRDLTSRNAGEVKAGDQGGKGNAKTTHTNKCIWGGQSCFACPTYGCW
jgi:hypothetical protein